MTYHRKALVEDRCELFSHLLVRRQVEMHVEPYEPSLDKGCACPVDLNLVPSNPLRSTSGRQRNVVYQVTPRSPTVSRSHDELVGVSSVLAIVIFRVRGSDIAVRVVLCDLHVNYVPLLSCINTDESEFLRIQIWPTYLDASGQVEATKVDLLLQIVAMFQPGEINDMSDIDGVEKR